MTAALNPSGHVTLDPVGRLDMDLPCVGCDYNLRGLLPDGACPECGKPVAFATRLVKLGRRDPLYLRRVAIGLQWLIAGMAAVVAAGLCSPLTYYFHENPTARERVDQSTMALLTAGAVLIIIGAFSVTTPHEPGPPRLRIDRRQTARVGIALGLAMLLFGLRMVERLTDTPGLIYWTACAIILAVGFRAALRYGAELAAQIDHPGLAIQARTLARMLAGLAWGVIFYVLLLNLPATWNANMGINPPVWGIRLLILGLASLALLLVWALVLLIWYRKRVVEAARLAEILSPVQ